MQQEIRYVRRHDPAQPGSFVSVPADLTLTPLLAAGLLAPCRPDDPHEQSRFVHYATMFRSDGEAMCLALAESRGWAVATDDRKAIRIGGQAGLTVISCPQILKAWSDATHPDRAFLVEALVSIQTLAKFVPHPSMPEAAWWGRMMRGS